MTERHLRARNLQPPHKFEAGTPNIAGAIGLALRLITRGIGRKNIFVHDAELTARGAAA